jgi:hypothetical protein
MLMPLLLVVYNAWNSLSASLGWKTGPASVPLGPDQQLPRTILDLSHSPLGISQLVEDDLLELDSIASDTRKIAGELGAENHPVFLSSLDNKLLGLPRGTTMNRLYLSKRRPMPSSNGSGSPLLIE